LGLTWIRHYYCLEVKELVDTMVLVSLIKSEPKFYFKILSFSSSFFGSNFKVIFFTYDCYKFQEKKLFWKSPILDRIMMSPLYIHSFNEKISFSTEKKVPPFCNRFYVVQYQLTTTYRNSHAWWNVYTLPMLSSFFF